MVGAIENTFATLLPRALSWLPTIETPDQGSIIVSIGAGGISRIKPTEKNLEVLSLTPECPLLVLACGHPIIRRIIPKMTSRIIAFSKSSPFPPQSLLWVDFGLVLVACSTICILDSRTDLHVCLGDWVSPFYHWQPGSTECCSKLSLFVGLGPAACN